MPDTGSPWLLPYPAIGEAANVPEDVGALATATDAALDALAAADVAAAAVVTTTNAGAVATGWTLSTLTARKLGKLGMIEGAFTKITAAIVADANGNTTNTLICTIAAGFRPVARTLFTMLYASNSAGAAGLIETSGSVSIISALPNVDVAVGSAISFSAIYLVP